MTTRRHIPRFNGNLTFFSMSPHGRGQSHVCVGYMIHAMTTRRHGKSVKFPLNPGVASYSSGVSRDHVGRCQEWACSFPMPTSPNGSEKLPHEWLE